MFGQSLGSFGAEAAFAGTDAGSSVAHMEALTDGVLYTGPTNGNEIWGQMTTERDEASPVWRPVFEDGVSVRFANQPEELLEPDPSWKQPRHPVRAASVRSRHVLEHGHDVVATRMGR